MSPIYIAILLSISSVYIAAYHLPETLDPAKAKPLDINTIKKKCTGLFQDLLAFFRYPIFKIMIVPFLLKEFAFGINLVYLYYIPEKFGQRPDIYLVVFAFVCSIVFGNLKKVVPNKLSEKKGKKKKKLNVTFPCIIPIA